MPTQSLFTYTWQNVFVYLGSTQGLKQQITRLLECNGYYRTVSRWPWLSLRDNNVESCIIWLIPVSPFMHENTGTSSWLLNIRSKDPALPYPYHESFRRDSYYHRHANLFIIKYAMAFSCSFYGEQQTSTIFIIIFFSKMVIVTCIEPLKCCGSQQMSFQQPNSTSLLWFVS